MNNPKIGIADSPEKKRHTTGLPKDMKRIKSGNKETNTTKGTNKQALAGIAGGSGKRPGTPTAMNDSDWNMTAPELVGEKEKYDEYEQR